MADNIPPPTDVEFLAEQCRRELDEMNYYEGTLRRETCIARHIHAGMESAEADNARLRSALKERSRELVPDYPYTGDDPFESLWALAESLKGTRMANDDCHKAIAGLKDQVEHLRISEAGWLNEYKRLKDAIRDSGYGLLHDAGGKLSIHDVSERARVEEEKTANVVAHNIELEVANDDLSHQVMTLKVAIEDALPYIPDPHARVALLNALEATKKENRP